MSLLKVASFQEGPGILAKDFVEHGVPLVRLAGLGGYEVGLNGCNFIDPDLVQRKWNHFRLKQGDILVSTSATFGRPAIVGPAAQGALFYTGLIRFRSCSETLDEGYLKTFLSSTAFMQQAEAFASGSVIRHFGPSHLKQMFIPLPPLSTQKNIARVLGVLDDKIDLNRRMNETLEAMARAIFKDWFIDFGPTRAKMKGGAPYLAPEVWALFPDRLDDKGNPEGWETRPLLDLCQLKRGYDLPTNQRVHGRFPIVSSSGFSGYHTAAMAGAPGVVTGRYGTIGKVFFIDTEFWPLNTALYVKDFKGNSPRFVFHTVRNLDFQQFSDKGAVPGVNRNDLHRAPVVLPSHYIQDAFEKSLSPMWQRIAANESEATTLAHMRDLLLPKLMSGELRVRDAERVVEAAL